MITIDGFKVRHCTWNQMEEIGQLASDGHNDALVAFGKDFVYYGYERGVRDCLIGMGLGVAVAATVSAVKQHLKKRKLKKAVKEFNEFVETQTEEAK